METFYELIPVVGLLLLAIMGLLGIVYFMVKGNTLQNK